MLEVLHLVSNPETLQSPRAQLKVAPEQSKSAQKLYPISKVVQFVPKEVDMMPGNWAEPGNPTPYELCTTLQTCKRLWHLNKEALTCFDCDQEVTLHNIKVLEKLYIHLMDYLVE
ncbi:hypothetical protein [Thiosulfativibrio zosterae]|uniref:Uncharacterized protein n=1 Tax=Thiosulfativibrio zosterae TaxID=2675053 RepID=A0A6F8PMR3_9GAMM|nr:hypothetical protein [Thiosulfativibrio zosterae]BBP43403.1 hypothetical protein THMIRHAT_11490 [Thiosulfativibrio zosterae]